MPSIKRPKSETENQQRHNTNSKYARDLTPNCVLLQDVYRVVVFSLTGNKRDVKYGNTLNIVRNLSVIVDLQ
jgi:hypothetical protein